MCVCCWPARRLCFACSISFIVTFRLDLHVHARPYVCLVVCDVCNVVMCVMLVTYVCNVFSVCNVCNV